MAGGQKISDHSFFAGGASKASPFPEGVHTKQYTSAEGAGAENDYEQTSEDIQRVQKAGVAKVKSHPQKPMYRN